jgi:hypothetical protein
LPFPRRSEFVGERIVAFNCSETQTVKGMLARGDRQHDIAAVFGVNGGRIAEVATGQCNCPNAPALPAEKLPPKGPYCSPRHAFDAKIIRMSCGEELAKFSGSDAKAAAPKGINAAISKLSSLS